MIIRNKIKKSVLIRNVFFSTCRLESYVKHKPLILTYSQLFGKDSCSRIARFPFSENKTFIYLNAFHWERCFLFKEHHDHIQSWKLPSTVTVCWPQSSSTGAVWVEGPAEGHLSGGNGSPSPLFTYIYPVGLRDWTGKLCHRLTSLTFRPPLPKQRNNKITAGHWQILKYNLQIPVLYYSDINRKWDYICYYITPSLLNRFKPILPHICITFRTKDMLFHAWGLDNLPHVTCVMLSVCLKLCIL